MMIDEKNRTIVAVFLAPVIGCLFGVTTYGSLNVLADGGPIEWGSIFILPFYALAYGVSVGAGAMIVGGIPAHLILKRLGLRAVWVYALAGVLVGVATPFAVFAAVSAMTGGGYTAQQVGNDAIRTLPLSAWLGLCTSLVAWLIRRPDRDEPNPPTSPS